MKKYVIIAALDYEVNIIRDALGNASEISILGFPAYKGIIGSCEVAVMRCGMGKVSAAIATQAMIDFFRPDYVINTGCAGALSPELRIGDVVVSECVVEWDLDLRAIGYPIGYIDAIGCVEMRASKLLCEKILAASGAKVPVYGMIVSADQFVSEDSQRKYILSNFPAALCAEMEGAAVGQACMQNNVPFCIIRTMSDTADGNSGVDFASFSVDAGKESAERLIAMLNKEC